MPTVRAIPRSSFLVALPLVASLAVVISSSGASPPVASATGAVIDDWSHHRLVFSDPGTMEEAIGEGNLDRWLKVSSDPRYKLQQLKRRAAANGSFELPQQDSELNAPEEIEVGPPGDPFADLPSDRLPRALIRVPAGAGGVEVPHHSPANRRRRVRRTLRTDWSEDMGSGASAGLGVYPAKFSFNISTANCASAAQPDFVVYNTSLAGSSGQASIMAYDNLYQGCGGQVPSVYWAYNTGGAIVTSVVLSLDGSQIAFAQSTSGAASLVILKWAASNSESASSPMTLTSTGSYHGCTAPCMTTIPFRGGGNDSGSSPYYDYTPGSDTLYIGDDNGNLHKFTGVFAGTPSEVTSGGWPASVSTQPLGGPVFDSVSGKIFVGDYLPAGSPSTCEMSGCGFLYSVNASSGAVAGKSSLLDYQFGIVDSPLVDSSAQMIYAFVGADGSRGCSSDQQCAGVFQFPTSFTSGRGTEATIGAGFDFLMSGTFDNEYFTSSTASSPTGHLYAVGNTGLANNTLYQIAINSNVLSTSAVVGPELANNFSNSYISPGLPITEIANGGHDYLFVSVLYFGLFTNCDDDQGNGCVLVFDVSSGTVDASTTPLLATAEAGGTSGIVIDNTSSFSGASNIYFSTLANQACLTSGGTGGCAIQSSQ